MLTDEQVDELERVIFGSTIDDLPMILGKALPLLFAELRVVRATLDSKVASFLGEVEDGQPKRTAGGMRQNVSGGGFKPEQSDGANVRQADKSGDKGTPKRVRRRKNQPEVEDNTGGDRGSEAGDQGQLERVTGGEGVDGKKKRQPKRARAGRKQDDALEVPDLSFSTKE